MANVIKPKMLLIDTASATPIFNYRLKISSITHIEAVGTGDTAVVQDANGNPIFRHVAGAANDEGATYYNTWFNGLKVPTLASGKLQIILD